MGLNMILPLAGGLAVLGILVVVVLMKKRTAYLGPVREELQKEKMWLRRGEYNAAMVKGRQNLELLLKLVAEKNGIQLDNTAQAVANAREEDRQGQKNPGKRGGRKKEKRVMTHHQFNRWLAENGYLDRVAKWEMSQVRLIGNKAVHENYADKEDAWNQYNYLEDILKTVTEKSQNPKKHHERKGAEKTANVAVADTEVQEIKKKRRRRRKKKPQGEVSAEVKVQAEVKAPAKKTVPEAAKATEEDGEAKKKRRRRRKKKPQGEMVTTQAANAQPVQVINSVPEKTVPEKKKTEKKAPEKKAPEKKASEEKTPEQKAPEKKTPKAKPVAEVERAANTAVAENGQTGSVSGEAKKKRRRRRRKPQAKSADGATGTVNVPEDKNENN